MMQRSKGEMRGVEARDVEVDKRIKREFLVILVAWGAMLEGVHCTEHTVVE